jgi:hypothetical protein
MDSVVGFPIFFPLWQGYNSLIMEGSSFNDLNLPPKENADLKQLGG